MHRGMIILLTLALALLVLPWAASSQGPEAPAGGTPAAEDIDGVYTFDEPSAAHTEGPVDYPQTPPVGGPHNPVWQNCGFYDRPVRNENAVHSLEHGAVWITYGPDLPADQVDELRRLARRNEYLLVSPFPDLPAPVIASAWGKQLRLESADDPRLREFVRAYAGQGPEPGAPCDGGTRETVPLPAATPPAATAAGTPTDNAGN